MRNVVFAAVLAAMVSGFGCGDETPDKGPVEVAVYDAAGKSAAGVPVVVHNRKGKVLEQANTDGDGLVLLENVPKHAMITVARRGSYDYHLQTLAGVQPFNNIDFGKPADASDTVPVTVGLPAAHATAKRYLVDAGCDFAWLESYSDEVTLDIRQACIADGEVSVVVYATDDNAIIHGYTYARDAAVNTTGTTTVALPEWSNDRTRFELDVPDLPWGETARARARFVAPNDSFVGTGPVELREYVRSYEIEEGQQTLQGSFDLPTGFDQALGYSLRLVGRGRVGFVAQRDAERPGARSLDLADDLLPFPTGLELELLNGTTPKRRPRARWTVDARGVAAQVAGFEITWADGPGQPARMRWEMAAPPAVTELRMPRLPDELVRFTPLEGDEYRSARVWLREADFMEHHLQYYRYARFFAADPPRLTDFPETFTVRSSVQRREYP